MAAVAATGKLISFSAFPWRTSLLAAGALSLAAAPAAHPALVLGRSAVTAGEPWRLVTGHLVHGSPYHLLWNVLALLALGWLFEPALGRRLWGLLVVTSVAVGGGTMLLQPELPSYFGLSGLLNGIWVGGALFSARKERGGGGDRMARLYVLCVVAGLCKIALEAWSGSPLFTDVSKLGGHPVPLAHALGALGGMLWLGMGLSHQS